MLLHEYEMYFRSPNANNPTKYVLSDIVLQQSPVPESTQMIWFITGLSKYLSWGNLA